MLQCLRVGSDRIELSSNFADSISLYLCCLTCGLVDVVNVI